MSQNEELIVEVATKVHADYCEDEYGDFYSRIQAIKKEGKITKEGDILQAACYDNGVKRNDIILDTAWLQMNELKASMMFSDYEIFKEVIAHGGCVIKDFASRELTEDEIINTQTEGDYRDYRIETGEENILRPFSELSIDSKKENLAAAVGAYQVYEQLSLAGITVEQMENNPEIRNLIGVAIHTDWLKRNMDHEDESIKIPFCELNNQAKEQDLTVFGALLHVVKTNPDKYGIKPVKNHPIPDYIEMEKAVLSNNKNM